MNLVMISAGRADYQPTLASLPRALHREVTVYVPRAEYRAYRNSELLSNVGEIVAWPEHIDCVPKKRKWFALNLPRPYLVLDDDLTFSYLDRDGATLRAPDYDVKAFIRRWRGIEEHSDCGYFGIGSRFMAQNKVKNGLVLNEVPGCACGYGSKAKAGPKFPTFFFSDVLMPAQQIAAGADVRSYYGIVYSTKVNKKLSSTGTNVYRKESSIRYSGIAAALSLPGLVRGMKFTGNSVGGWTLFKSFSGLRDLSPKAREHSCQWLLSQARELRMDGWFKKPMELDLETPLEELLEYHRWYLKTPANRQPRFYDIR